MRLDNCQRANVKNRVRLFFFLIMKRNSEKARVEL